MNTMSKYNSPNNEFEKDDEILCIEDIVNKSSTEYEKEIKNLPYISNEHCVNIRKKKVEPAGFAFYIKYEIPILKEKEQKLTKNNNKCIPIDELFLYNDKIHYLEEIKKNETNIDDDKNKDSSKNLKNEKYQSDNYEENNNSKKKEEKASLKKNTNLVKKCINNNINVYEILDVEESDDLETIKSAYKKLILIFHPDKNKGTSILNEKEKVKKKKKNNKDDDKNNEIKKDIAYYIEKYNIEKLTQEEKKSMFLKIQDSYAVLSDKILRKQYDSSIPFDETIPTKAALDEAPNFYEFLNPVFKRNAKWSSIKPVPNIGDENTSIDKVKYFYDFWYEFTSWRDFSYQNEYDYEEAECREERRWMERENKKIQKKASKAEKLRINKLVDLAYNNDPRIIAENKRIEMEKQKKKALAMLEKEKNKMNTMTNGLQSTNKTGSNNNIDQTNSSNDKKNKDNKTTSKIWKHHIKSVCVTKLYTIFNFNLIQDKLNDMPFDTLCQFVYEIYYFLNFNINKPDNSSAEKINIDQNLGKNEKEATFINTNKNPRMPNTNDNNTRGRKNSLSNNTGNEGNKNTGFIAHLKGVELSEKDIELLLDIFRKYINNFNSILEMKENIDIQDIKNEKETPEQKDGHTDEKNNITTNCSQNDKVTNEQIMEKSNSKEIAVEEKKNKKEDDEGTENNTNTKWTPQEISLLSKALKLYPGGTKNRWTVIANSIKTKNVKEVIKKTKEMFENETLKNLSKNFEESAFDNFKNQNKGVMKKIDDKLDKREYKHINDQNHVSNPNSSDNNSEQKKPWTHEEQMLLEKALMKHPATIPTKERLKLVANELKTRTVEEIVLRLKTIKAKIMAKNAAK
ncbi:DNA-binding chaperone, putative [Plasmodium chabaudi chabaudi]|uniref:DNA-binding chaperone, putative n=1 Tax=Plasmodium chabaudi chabaudi TaxID=31271 RepID=A0A4V0KCY0_PLACU|nr:DNA-binding chaperone, putative [Plasmodium chabaudi chabaudi]VTZ71023.1 DNA-binding chaperone, putative [Plasmodium chabaudi chabaudi]|eukprot:XP_744850.2 DNA-binding chaperone, putative [Plasmodium chabaudi chabaudi]